MVRKGKKRRMAGNGVDRQKKRKKPWDASHNHANGRRVKGSWPLAPEENKDKTQKKGVAGKLFWPLKTDPLSCRTAGEGEKNI